MKNTYESSGKAKSIGGWKKHLRKFGKRKVNKSSRREAKFTINFNLLSSCNT